MLHRNEVRESLLNHLYATYQTEDDCDVEAIVEEMQAAYSDVMPDGGDVRTLAEYDGETFRAIARKHGICDSVNVMDEDGREVYFDAAAEYMDDDIREALNHKMAPCSPQAFYDAYCAAHREKYGEDFVI